MFLEIEFLETHISFYSGWSRYTKGQKAHFEKSKCNHLVSIGVAKFTDDTEPITKTDKADIAFYKRLSVPELRDIAKEKGIQGIYSMKKAELIKELIK